MMQKSYWTPVLVISPVVLLGTLYGVMQMVDPASAGPWGILGVFLLLYLVFLSVFFVLLRFGLYWLSKLIIRGKKSNESARVFDQKKAYYTASILALVPVTLLAMHAFSKIQWSDILLVALLTSLAIFYILKRY